MIALEEKTKFELSIERGYLILTANRSNKEFAAWPIAPMSDAMLYRSMSNSAVAKYIHEEMRGYEDRHPLECAELVRIIAAKIGN